MQVEGPKISVVMPVYNAERYLSEAMRSILSQSFKDFEFLIVNDGSTDSTKSIIDKFAAVDSRIQSWDRENDGLVSALNFMLEKSKGEFIARMDADDIAMPNRFEVQLDAFMKNPEVVLVGGQTLLIDENSRKLGLRAHPLTHDEIDDSHLRGHASVCHPMAMMQRNAAIEVGGYREEYIYAEDVDLWLRLAEVGYMMNLPKRLLQYRIHASSICNTRQVEQEDAVRRGCESAWKRRGVEGEYAHEFSNVRATAGRDTRYRTNIRYAWMAWEHGYRSTWWYYTLQAIKLRPMCLDSWKALFFGAIRRP